MLIIYFHIINSIIIKKITPLIFSENVTQIEYLFWPEIELELGVYVKV